MEKPLGGEWGLRETAGCFLKCSVPEEELLVRWNEECWEFKKKRHNVNI